MKVIERASILDIVSLASQRDTAVLLPTLNHAIVFWKVLGTAFSERHGEGWIVQSRSAITMRSTHTVLRLGVPYAGEPTLPFDFADIRKGFQLVTPHPYLAYDVRAWLL